VPLSRGTLARASFPIRVAVWLFCGMIRLCCGMIGHHTLGACKKASTMSTALGCGRLPHLAVVDYHIGARLQATRCLLARKPTAFDCGRLPQATTFGCVHICVCLCVCTCMHVYTCIHVRMYICTYVCAYTYIYTYVYIHIYIYVYMYICIDLNENMYLCKKVHRYAKAGTAEQHARCLLARQPHLAVSIHIYVYMCVCLCVHLYIYIYIYICKCKCMFIYTYIYE